MVEIRRALNDQSQQLIRTVARRGYVFAAPVTNPVVEFPSAVAGAEPGPAPVGLPKPWRLSASRALMVAVALLIPAVGAVLLRSVAWRAWRAPENQGPIRAVPLNSLPGVQRYPSFSPDGEHVAFTWTGPNQDNQDVYVQRIASGSLLRLTTDQVIDYNPVWSPDDRWIAFLRRRWKTGTSELRVLPALGGPERKVADIRISETYFIVPPYLTWCPDSKCLVVTDSPGEGDPAGLFVVSLETGEKSLLTRPQFPAIGDSNPAISSDGTWLVFRRQTNLHSGELYRLSLQRPTPGASADVPAGLTSAGEPQRLTPAALDAGYPTWMPGNKEILFSARGHLWRLSVMGRNRPAQLPFVGEDGIMPVVSNSQSGGARRLVYVRSFQDSNIWRLEFSGPGATASTPPAVSISSTRMDSTPQLSPDGQRVAFVSDRSGAWEIWVADPNGSQAVQLTFVGADSGAPCWSPDGEWIVFQSNPQGQADVYVIRAAGGKPRNLSHHPATESRPSFSRNGQWVYFTSNRTGQRQIWKVSVSGGDPV
jgi:Tol biopolymer transport system component